MWPISIIEICIYDLPHKLEYNIFEAFHLAPCSTYHLIFLNQHILLRDRCLKFFIFHFDEMAFGFWGIIQFYFWSLSLFPNQILVCAKAFVALYLFLFGDLHLMSSFSHTQKKKKKKVRRYIGTSLCMSQDQQNHSLVIHDKVEDLFTTVT